MPRVGGVYEPPSGIPVSNGSVASSTVINSVLDDLGDEITNSVPRDGSAAASADLPMGTKKHTNVGNAAARNQYTAVGQLQDGSLVTLGSVAGTNTITGALTPAITAYAAGMRVSFEPANTNTGAATIAINGLAAVNIVKHSGVSLSGGELVADVPALLIYDGTQFFLVNPATTAIGKYKASNTSRTATTTLADDPDLVIPLTAGTWEYEAHVYWRNVTSTDPDIKMAMVYSGTRTLHVATSLSYSGSVTAYLPNSSAGSLESGFGLGATLADTDYVIAINGTITVSDAGNLKFQWAQLSSHANAARVNAGSRLVARKIA